MVRGSGRPPALADSLPCLQSCRPRLPKRSMQRSFCCRNFPACSTTPQLGQTVPTITPRPSQSHTETLGGPRSCQRWTPTPDLPPRWSRRCVSHVVLTTLRMRLHLKHGACPEWTPPMHLSAREHRGLRDLAAFCGRHQGEPNSREPWGPEINLATVAQF